MNDPKVAICILNWNNYLHTLGCITSIEYTEYKNYEIIVIDNASSDNSVSEIRRAYPNIKLVENTSNLGYADGNWEGVKKALEDSEIELIWILNNDAQLARRNTLSALVNAYRLSPQPAIFGSVILEPDPLSDTDMVHIARWVDIW